MRRRRRGYEQRIIAEDLSAFLSAIRSAIRRRGSVRQAGRRARRRQCRGRESRRRPIRCRRGRRHWLHHLGLLHHLAFLHLLALHHLDHHHLALHRLFALHHLAFLHLFALLGHLTLLHSLSVAQRALGRRFRPVEAISREIHFKVVQALHPTQLELPLPFRRRKPLARLFVARLPSGEFRIEARKASDLAQRTRRFEAQ
jgi:hypothetical protein